ncbi:SDR family NAD(P)-dependent oxidoreductase [Opitutus terrae]|uniref:Short-chain dehydrogenase/reductase SDR n=1 Tax=Opitutus terrae (strain DSM 11246 / JCM 15787 / PB90-1) TaxID=452637 RepID=B1ZUV4_OPITP|nr:SDR family NAD(P)-dependent oxidoreductase [Opitutus terrae]ACB75924.1 short-chain dehydrogenase/reductase SDR [Opitutus terrae PB90-1]
MIALREVCQSFTAVVLTGGSSGIGKSFIELAGNLYPALRFCNLSRTAPVIKSEELILCHVPCDLASVVETERAATEVEAFLNRDVPAGRVLLINNSGFGSYGAFPEPNLSQQLEMLQVNTVAMVRLTGRLLPVLKARGGVVMNIASTAAFQPTPHLAVYGATKSFVLNWTLALNEEWRGTNLRAMAVCPGPTSTPFFQRAGLAPGNAAERTGMSTEAVVLAALRGLAKGKSLVVPGWKNKLLAAASGMGPRTWVARISGQVIAAQRLQHVRA